MLTQPIVKPVAVEVVRKDAAPEAPSRAPVAARLAVIIVTWNRRGDVCGALEALGRQTYGPGRLDVVVVDNAGTDGTVDLLAQRFRPEAIVENHAALAHEPRFQPPAHRTPGLANTLGLGSLTVVRNRENFGGCGGFNTGFAYVARVLDEQRRGAGGAAPDFVWLVDDDIDLAPDACAHLVRAAESDPTIGLVGTRTVDINDRRTTIETTIYFDAATGCMSDEPTPRHRLKASHDAWIAQVGGTKGDRAFTGLRDVDVCSACSLLARWDAVRTVGFWDYRYFIYSDDSDWCLRFGRAGYRVVLSLDAVVYHTPWHHKLTPVRAYYADRNILWVIQKIVPADRLRGAVARKVGGILKHAAMAATHRRLFHAEIIRRSAADAMSGRWGKLDREGPAFEDIGSALDRAGMLRKGARIGVMGNWHEYAAWSEDIRRQCAAYLDKAGRAGDMPRWLEIVRNDMPGAEAAPPPGVERVVYSPRLRSKLRRQLSLLVPALDGLVVFNQYNDFPLFRGGYNIHIDRRRPTQCQLERDGLRPRLAFLVRWAATCLRSLLAIATLKGYSSPTKYG